MFNPPNSYPNPLSEDELLKRMTQRMQQQKVDQQILDLLKRAIEKELDQALGQATIVPSRSARIRLFQQVAQAIFTDVLGKMGDPNDPNR